MAPGGQLGEKTDGAAPERQTLGCGGRPGLSLLLERTRTLPGEQGQTETHARTSRRCIRCSPVGALKLKNAE